MVIKMTGQDKELPENMYEIWCDNVIPVEAEIITPDEAKQCWLMKAEYIMPLDKYKAIYKAYTNKGE